MKQSKKSRKDMLHSIEDLLWRESMPNRAVLLLNASEEVLSVIDWKKAFNLLYNGKARAAHGHDHHYDIQSTTGTFRLPSAIVLVQYTYIPFRTAGKCTRKNVETTTSVNIAESNYQPFQKSRRRLTTFFHDLAVAMADGRTLSRLVRSVTYTKETKPPRKRGCD